MSDNPNANKPKYIAVKVTGLFEREYNGEHKLSGKLPDGTIVEVITNKFRSKDTHPAFIMNRVVLESSEEGQAELKRREEYKASKAAAQGNA